MNNSTILIVDDDVEIRDLITLLLTNEGYTVYQAENGERAISLMNTDVDLVILDIMMPGMTGYKVCSIIREQYNSPVLFLTAKGMDSDLTIGYSCGGDDYLTKPFSSAELLARIKGLLRRYKIYMGKEMDTRRDAYLVCGDLKVHPEFNEVFKADTELNLTEIEYQLLRLMLQYRGKIFTMQNLYERVWNEPFLSTSANTVMVHIRKLRSKIEEDPKNSKFVKTVWGKGYRVEKET
ncbi:DNA-binding response regulator [Paenibacillus helianthi]|uniref:DNA-binding response regulator n=1 Tax=Paenibacillus helianthi TaxID=1349432 RepID=A0ABX3ET15_9BACL|nr:response regulator transcription factor [Paenibacillus helianthi]OKP90455.1 DNA-binding response regulator [Paenibacillus helianthi]